MSFIYEALKRAEDDNQQRVTTPVRSDAGVAVFRGRTRWWAWALIGVLGANALVAGTWMIVRGQRSPNAPPAPAVASPLPPAALAPRMERGSPVVSSPVARSTPPPAARPSERTAPAPPLSAPVDAPKLTLQVLVYSEAPGQRMVFIDGRRYTEGDAIDAETVLERITAEGAVVRRRGQRFVISDRRP